MSWSLKEATLAQRIVIIMGVLLCLAFGFRFALPPSLWFEVGSLDIHSAARWQDVTVEYDRTIHRQFEGAWRVEVARKSASGWEEVCATPGNPNTYETDAVLRAVSPDQPNVVSLEWFVVAPDECFQLPPAEYRLCAVWTINTDSWLQILTRTVRRCAQFEVIGR